MTGLADLTPEERQRLPAKAREELEAPAGAGFRHVQVNRLLPNLIGNGIQPDRAFELLRARYDSDFQDEELWGLICWHADKAYTPTVFAGGQAPTPSPFAPPPRRVTARRPKETPEQKKARKIAESNANAESFLDGFRCTSQDVIARSVVPIPLTGVEMARSFLTHAYGNNHRRLVNFVTDYTLDKDGKANPVGEGETWPIYPLLQHILSQGVPQGAAGVWVRHNPVKAKTMKGGLFYGSGKGGAWTDADVEEALAVVIESDILPLPLQVSLLARMELPIVALVDSGGRSVQALVRLSGGAAEGRQIIEALEPLGVDPCNRNPSRLSRLPGAVRKIRARDPQRGTLQRLLYLNPNPSGKPIL